ncbi:synaptic vesicle glycoprotein 2A [Xylocopa sonorina]|uniref:synaptic vesicle glycoprotein 2A n=1 Tax=Xylocopa sonorina TaxID=1818115 RepID=UPI00403B1619
MVTHDERNGNISTINVKIEQPDESGDIEKAISAAGYGRFNVLLFLSALPVAWTGIFDTTTTAFILASAECDLQLTFFRKGVLTAMPFLAMALTSFLWDYVTPYLATKHLFVLALLLDSILDIVAATLVDSYYAFLAIKFFNGVLAGGPFSMVMKYLSEFHSAKYNASFTRWAGLAVNAAMVFPAIIAFLITPLPLTIDVSTRRYTSWRIYLLICSIVPVLGLVTASTLPQTPKYFVEIGKPGDALRLLGKIYSVNKRKSSDMFPIKTLHSWKNAALPRPSFVNRSLESIRLACYNAKLLFSSSYLRAVAYLNFLQFGSMLGFHTMRLWVPQLFIILNNFDYERWTDDRAPTMCEMLDLRMVVPARQYLKCPNFDDICLTWKIRPSVYQNSSIIAFSAVVFSFLVGTISTTNFRKQAIMLAGFLLSVVSSFGINWAQAPPYMLTLASAIIVTSRITGNIVTAVNLDVIPLPLRSTSLSLLTTVGNVAAVFGHFVFSALLEMQCLAAFMGMGCLLFACFCLSFYRPKPIRTSTKSLAQPEA